MGGEHSVEQTEDGECTQQRRAGSRVLVLGGSLKQNTCRTDSGVYANPCSELRSGDSLEVCSCYNTVSDSSLIVILVMISEDCATVHNAACFISYRDIAQCSEAKHGKDGMS